LKVAPTAWAVQSHQTTREHFTGPYEHRLLPEVGHNVPQEAPEAFAEAVTTLLP
jgi:pimeloyl-ACP methyl ester carboxylesterase